MKRFKVKVEDFHGDIKEMEVTSPNFIGLVIQLNYTWIRIISVEEIEEK